jgi:hypothetical protein
MKEENYCCDCEHKLGEECAVTVREIYDDSEACQTHYSPIENEDYE